MELPLSITNLIDELEGQTIAWDAMQDSTIPYFTTIINEIDNLQYLIQTPKRDFEDGNEDGFGVLDFFVLSKEKLIESYIQRIEKLISSLRSSM